VLLSASHPTETFPHLQNHIGMNPDHTQRNEITSATAVDVLAQLSRFWTAADLHRMARHTEAEGAKYAAAMQWRKAACLFGSEEWLVDACWQQWERIMNLSRSLAAVL
jgi:hypothetical protein